MVNVNINALAIVLGAAALQAAAYPLTDTTTTELTTREPLGEYATGLVNPVRRDFGEDDEFEIIAREFTLERRQTGPPTGGGDAKPGPAKKYPPGKQDPAVAAARKKAEEERQTAAAEKAKKKKKDPRRRTVVRRDFGDDHEFEIIERGPGDPGVMARELDSRGVRKWLGKKLTKWGGGGSSSSSSSSYGGDMSDTSTAYRRALELDERDLGEDEEFDIMARGYGYWDGDDLDELD